MEINKQAKYEGYIWLSDQTQPRVLLGEEFDVDGITDSINPFVIEGQLWNAADGISISIRYADGKHVKHFHQVTNEELQGTLTVTTEQYISHIKGVGRLCFLRKMNCARISRRCVPRNSCLLDLKKQIRRTDYATDITI